MSPPPQNEPLGALAAKVGRIRSISRGKLMAILGVLVVGMMSVYIFEPRIQADMGKAPDPGHPILTPIIISNGGFFAFRDVHLQCVAQNVEFAQTTAASSPAIDNNVLHVTSVAAENLPPGQKLAVACSRGLEDEAGLLRYADLDINVCLKPYPLIDYISLVHFRYVGRRDRYGSLLWEQEPLRRSSIEWAVSGKETDKQECQWAE